MEVESCQKESRQHASELFKLKTTQEELLEQLEALRRENKAYQGRGGTSCPKLFENNWTQESSGGSH